jgi:hypothetical protein
MAAALGSAAAAQSTLILGGCSAYPAEDGEAFAPWAYPGSGGSRERSLVHAALLAASPHNTQPWGFGISDGLVDVFAATERSLGAMDPLGRELRVGLGCALENLVLAARAWGGTPSIAYFPTASNHDHVARVTLASRGTIDPLSASLHGAIPLRRTNRYAYKDGDTPAGLEASVRALVDDPDVSLTFLSDGAARARFRQGTIDATYAINADDEMSVASHAWWRQTHDEIERYRDGLTIDASGLGSTTRFLGKSTSQPTATQAGEYWLDNTKSSQTTGFGFGILSTTVRNDREQQLRCGRMWQRIHLWATTQNLAVQPLNQMAERQDREEQRSLAPTFTKELASLTGRPTSTAQMLFRIGVAWDDAFKSPRRPVAWVLR